jgi:hypothetical protein
LSILIVEVVLVISISACTLCSHRGWLCYTIPAPQLNGVTIEKTAAATRITPAVALAIHPLASVLLPYKILLAVRCISSITGNILLLVRLSKVNGATPAVELP